MENEKLLSNDWVEHEGLKFLKPMTEKQINYAKSLQEELKRLNPIRAEHVRLSVCQINEDTNPNIIDYLNKAIQYEEYMNDCIFEGQFMQD